MSAADAWRRIARGQVHRYRPDVTVLSVGADEGFPMRTADGTTHACCDDAWKDEYERRYRRVVRTYRRGGRAKVLALTVPLPREPRYVAYFAAVNDVILRADAMRGVRVLRMDAVFTPDGYTETIPFDGRQVDVREPDGIHLNVSGTSIAARIIAGAMRPLLR